VHRELPKLIDGPSVSEVTRKGRAAAPAEEINQVPLYIGTGGGRPNHVEQGLDKSILE